MNPKALPPNPASKGGWICLLLLLLPACQTSPPVVPETAPAAAWDDAVPAKVITAPPAIKIASTLPPMPPAHILSMSVEAVVVTNTNVVKCVEWNGTNFCVTNPMIPPPRSNFTFGVPVPGAFYLPGTSNVVACTGVEVLANNGHGWSNWLLLPPVTVMTTDAVVISNWTARPMGLFELTYLH